MAQKDTGFGGIRGSEKPVKASSGLRSDFIAALLGGAAVAFATYAIVHDYEPASPPVLEAHVN